MANKISRKERNLKFETLQLHVGQETPDPVTDARAVPIYQTSSYVFKNCDHAAARFGLSDAGNIYGRLTNPTEDVFEQRMAALEGGVAALAVASGAAALSYTFQNLAQSGDHIVAANNIYGGTYNYLEHTFPEYGVKTTFVDPSDLKSIEDAIQENTKAVFIETLGNPNSDVVDIEAIAKIAHENKIPLVIDNTFGTPYLIRPIEHGADIVIHSATKYLGGHSDLVAGLVVVKDEELGEKIHFIQNSTGGILQPFDSFLLIRGIKTLSVRMDRHELNANFIAEKLGDLEGIDNVYYPGLKTHIGHEIQKKQASGFGGIISFTLNKKYNYEKFFNSLELITFGESLGGVESLACHPASMTHAAMPLELRERIGITDRLIRISVGIEDKEDILEDIQKALVKAGDKNEIL